MGFEVTMSKASEDVESLTYAIQYAQNGAGEDASFTIFNETLTKTPGDVVLFDRSNPDDYAITKHLRLENDRSLFSAVRLYTGYMLGS